MSKKVITAQCPICGRFVKKERVDEYNESIESLKKALITVTSKLNDVNERNEELVNEYIKVKTELNSLKKRGFWGRVFNK